MHRGSAHPRRGFTLVEVLVVVAIISILAGILFPVLAQAREAGRRTTCSSNARQLSAAASMYTQDNDERLPVTTYDLTGAQRSSWMMQINPYLQNGQVYRCPSDPLQWNTWDGTIADTSVSYGYNFLFLNGTPLREIEKPTQTILLMDSDGAEGYG